MNERQKTEAFVRLHDRGYSAEIIAKTLDLKLENVKNAIKRLRGEKDEA
ncbi:hypothetical protein IIA15_09535 [candidate division TA06 bacterium]|nr:hypothetical protein [candidate division TA06 bacterium]